MATQLTFRRGTSEPTQASGLTLGEPAFNTALSTFHIGRGAGVTAAWIGAQISGLSTGIAAGLTLQVPTMSAVKDYVASTTSGVATLNSLTGAVTIAGGTNIGVTTAGSSITVTNLGVQTFNGATGAVTGASLGANTFTGINTFNAGITTSSIYASTGSTFGGTLKVVGGATFDGRVYVGGNAFVYGDFNSNGDAQFERVVTVLGGATFNATAQFTNGLTSSGSIQFKGTATKNIRSTQAPIVITGVTSGAGFGSNSITLPVDNSALLLGSVTGNVNIVNTATAAIIPGLRILTDDLDFIGSFGTVIKPGTFASAERTQTLQDASGVIALTSQLMGAVNGSTAATTAVTSFNGRTGAVQGVSAAVAGTGISVSGATGAVTITNIGVQSFNGATGAVTGASLGANTFTGLNTFNAGITTSFIYASTGSTFGGTLKVVGGATFDGRVDVAGILDVAGGVTFESTSDHGGAARFASTIVSTGSVTANGGLTASTLDVSGAARFASTVVSTGSITANGGLTASTLNVTGTAQTTGNMTVGATLTVTGNLIVNGTTTTINSTTLSVDDKNIVLADGNSTDDAADGGGITLKGATDKTFTWVDARDAWTSSEHMDLAETKAFKINGTNVLSSNALGNGVTGSILTAVGTLATGVWQATAIGATYGGTGLTSYTIGDVIYASGTGSLSKLGATTAGYLLSANGTGTAPEYKQLLVKDGGGTSIATITSASGTLSAAIQYATASLKGVASFDNTNFTVSTGAVTITGVDGGTY